MTIDLSRVLDDADRRDLEELADFVRGLEIRVAELVEAVAGGEKLKTLELLQEAESVARGVPWTASAMRRRRPWLKGEPALGRE